MLVTLTTTRCSTMSSTASATSLSQVSNSAGCVATLRSSSALPEIGERDTTHRIRFRGVVLPWENHASCTTFWHILAGWYIGQADWTAKHACESYLDAMINRTLCCSHIHHRSCCISLIWSNRQQFQLRRLTQTRRNYLFSQQRRTCCQMETTRAYICNGPPAMVTQNFGAVRQNQSELCGLAQASLCAHLVSSPSSTHLEIVTKALTRR